MTSLPPSPPKPKPLDWINDIRTQGDPRQQLNRLMEQWAAEMQAEIAGK